MSNIPCQFHALGRCSRGTSCAFSHDPSVCVPGAIKVLCRHEAARPGSCRNGDKCLYLHAASESVSPEKKKKNDEAYSTPRLVQLPLSTARAAAASYPLEKQELLQEESVYSYGDPLAFDKKNPWKRASFGGARAPPAIDYSKVIPAKSRAVCAPAPPAPAAATAAQAASTPQQSWPMSSQAFEFAFTEDEIAASQDLKCAVCLETVVKTDSEHVLPRRFGILPNCAHVFCLECIRGWRKSDISDRASTKEFARCCPCCRVESGFIVPSKYFVASKFRRFRLVATYKASLKRIPCKHFSASGTCPFGSSCFYLHVLADGSAAPLLDRALKGADGRAAYVSSVRFGDVVAARAKRE